MKIIVFLLICVVAYLLSVINKLKNRVALSEESADIEKILVRNFIRKSNALKDDVEKYKKDAFFDENWKDCVVFGENEDALSDKRQFVATLKKEDFDFMPDPELPEDEKAEELMRARISGIINSMQALNPKIINKPYADWFKTKRGFRSMMVCLRWMLPEIEGKLTKNKIQLTGDFIELKNAMITDDLINLMPNLFEQAKQAVSSK